MKPGLAFAIECGDAGFALGLHTHNDTAPSANHGALVWIAEGMWESVPTLDAVATASWRWCVFFPVNVAARRKLVIPLGRCTIPKVIEAFPVMRVGGRAQGWFVRDPTQTFSERRPTSDRTLPPRILVNYTALRDFILEDWRPEQMW